MHAQGVSACCRLHHRCQAVGELRCLHVIGETAKGRIPPGQIRRVGPRVPQAPEARQMVVRDSCSVQGARQRVPVELRVDPRPRNGADVEEPCHTVVPQEIDESLQGPGGVAHGEDGQA
jgi:hypothetical protein